MTSCLLAKAPDRIIAVADGRISVSAAKVSVDTAQKIIRFTPTYRVPIIDRGRFARYSDRIIEEWCIAYAGNAWLAGEIIRLFTARVTKGLFLVKKDGKSELAESFSEGRRYSDDYEFASAELIPLTPVILAEKLGRIARTLCDEFALNRAEFPDCQFLLFGRNEVTRGWSAYKVHTDDVGWGRGRTARLVSYEIPDGELATIGSANVAGAAYADDGLREGLRGWTVDKSKQEMDSVLADLNLDGPWPEPEIRRRDPENWTVGEVRNAFLDHIGSTSDPSVGGKMLVAEGGYYGDIELGSI